MRDRNSALPNKRLGRLAETRSRLKLSVKRHMKCLVAIILVLAAMNAPAADSVVTVSLDPLPNPGVEKHLAGIKAPKRSVQVVLEVGGPRTSITVIGRIEISLVIELLKAAMPQKVKTLGQRETPWDIVVVGDDQFASVGYSYVCGELCGRGASFVFGRDGNGWRFLYKANDWIA